MSQVPGFESKANRTAAEAFAEECQRYVRLIESSPTAESIEHAHQLGAITDDQAAALRGEQVALIPAKPIISGLVALAQRHPSSTREDLGQAKRHQDLLLRFVTWAKVERPEQVTVDLAQGWIAHLAAEGWAWDSRRHALLWLRRACMMATKDGLPDPLYGFRLDRRAIGSRATIVALPVEDLVRLLAALHPSLVTRRAYLEGKYQALTDHRLRAAAALGGCMGLRPSETYSVRVKHIDLDRQSLHTGNKNEASIRVLPLPLILCKWLIPLIADLAQDDYLFRTDSPRGSRPFTATTWSQWLGDHLRTITGVEGLQAKSLRKTFATWTARARWPKIELEAFLGHESSEVAPITARSYLADYRVDDLRPAAGRINQLLLDVERMGPTSSYTDSPTRL
jgi:integrase